MNSKIPKISIIIACYNHADFLEKVFHSLLNQTYRDFEVIIADDGSDSEIIELVHNFSNRFYYPIQHVWHENEGFRKTIIVNKAIRTSRSDYLIFIDGDCILHHKFISRHYKRRKKGTVLSGRRIMLNEVSTESITVEDIKSLTFEKSSKWWKHYKFKEWKRGLYLPFIFHFLNLSGKNYWAFGSNFSLYKSDLLNVNGYDENIIGRGLEDINLTQRFKLKGYRIKRLTYEALQYHLFHTSNPIPHSKKDEEKISNPKYFYASKGIN